MTETPPSRLELVAHMFAPLEGPHAAAATRYTKRMWSAFRRRLGTTEPIRTTGLSVAFPASLPTGSVLIAAQQAPDRSIQVILRREQDVLNLSVLFAALPPLTWVEHEHHLDAVLRKPPGEPVTGLARLYLGEVPIPARASGAATRNLIPPPAPDGGWWHRPYDPADGFLLWETASAPDHRPARRFVLLYQHDRADRVGEWLWAPGGHAPMPFLARYLMHLAKIRYQWRVWSDQRTGAHPVVAPDPARLLVDLTAMRDAVRDTWDNALNALAALAPNVADPAGDGPFAEDAGFTAWFVDQLSRDINRVKTGLGGAGGLRGPGIEPRGPATPVGPAAPSRSAARLQPKVGSPPTLLVLAEEWLPRRSAAAVINRRLCRALVEAGTRVYCMIPAVSDAERADADTAGVHLVEGVRFPGAPARLALGRRVVLPDRAVPDAVVGYGLATGPAAQTQSTDHYPGAAWPQVVLERPHHTDRHDPDEDDETETPAEDRASQEPGRAATCALPLGPVVDSWLQRDLPGPGGEPLPYRLDPGFDVGGRRARRPPRGIPQVLVVAGFGEVARNGLDTAARALGVAFDLRGPSTPWELLVRGAAPDRCEAFEETLRGWVGEPRIRVDVGDDSEVFGQLEEDLERVSLVLAPSRAEGISVVGLEAVAAGVPVLVGDSSGLGVLLREVLHEEANLLTAPVGTQPADTDRWASWIGAVLADRDAAFTHAESVRQAMAARYSWARAAEQVLSAVPRADGQT